MPDLHELTLTQAVRLIRQRKLSPIELLEASLARIDCFDGAIKAWAAVDREGAMRAAAELDREARAGRLRGPLHGVPVGIKDIFYTEGIKTEAGSKVLAGFVPDYDAEAVARLKRAGAIILGKLATAEFAFADAPATRNPWNVDHTPGGSSSGSAAAVAARMCQAAIGSQTIGSVVRPASYCGIVGMKPTFGRISRYGMLPLASSLDHVGIFARSTADAALMLQAMAGGDSRDPASRAVAVGDYLSAASRPIARPRIAMMPKAFDDRADEQTRTAVADVVGKLAGAGAVIEAVEAPSTFSLVEANAMIEMGAEAASVHRERFAEKKDLYGPKLRAFLERSLNLPAWEYVRALEVQRRFRDEIDRLLMRFDAILTPATPAPAPAGIESTGDPSFNRPWSVSGHPVLSLPCALAPSGLPIAIQLAGAVLEEGRLFGVARWCEEILAFDRIPGATPP
ncbi:MAG TPA: amidase [Candidatus Binataceae bacterium]|nr:amidase [Candidatus Binataceae bacterium]